VICNHCDLISINGIACHEHGCPNERKTWIEERGEWVRFVNCFVCGFPVEVGTQCDCQEDTEVQS
jgi:hypothetical protein